ncbi:peroxiredoxin, Ohr subfamily [Algoriella xinjiangensis]|uniref:Peroxiredoxin, Ohr subfamily n=1 Tax=Algoriella xinjiangensis TaxID=684065 RepID=A0A1I4S3X5_9FLAO|nr:organic hydroperoxide resistance protein [Algoriella xinjiangensis]SFM59192.1 peroxiredoxin, Ohr subfamily [Algoriella xinjiangensis]VDH15888.1 General stress protein 17o [Algoriella xinjiangensis]
MKTLYTASVTATGGRNGKVKSENGIVDFDVRMPKALGGANDDYLNPELLFAAGYSACFDSALNLVLQQNKVKAETTVKADVSIGQLENGGFGLAAVLTISVLGVSLEDAKLYAEKAHQICPYSNATRNNIDVELIVSNN